MNKFRLDKKAIFRWISSCETTSQLVLLQEFIDNYFVPKYKPTINEQALEITCEDFKDAIKDKWDTCKIDPI